MPNTQPVVKTYTTDVILRISSQYQADPTPETVKLIASELGVSDRSVIAKLSSLGIYKKQVYLNKSGAPPVRKEVYIEKIATLLGIDIQLLECLEKCTKQALTVMESRIRELDQQANPPTLERL